MIKQYFKNWTKLTFVVALAISLAFSLLIWGVLSTSMVTGGDSLFSSITDNPLKSILLLVIIWFVLTMAYLVMNLEKNGAENIIKSQTLVSFAILLTVVLAVVTDMYFGRFARPLALAGIFIAVTLNRKSAIYASVALSMIFMLMEGFSLGVSAEVIVPTVAQLFGAVVMIIIVSREDTRIKTVYTVVAMIPVYAVLCLVFTTIFMDLTGGMLMQVVLQSALSPILSGFIYLGILPLFEVMFKIVTPYYLTELTDVNKGILLKLSKEAPGTFNHSLAVANIAGACAHAIGADVRLTRACGYYHDIGKIHDPSVFKENLINDEQNPHDKLTPELSVNLLKRHVSYGVELMRKKGLPQEIIDAAAEHHGTLPMKFFYFKAQKFTDGFVDIKDYSYDGPIPTSKITAILMIVDASEAAVRTLTERTRAKIDEIVRSIIEERMELEQFDHCDITFKDLQIIRNTIVDNLAGIYHERIEYPKFKITREKIQEEKNDSYN